MRGKLGYIAFGLACYLLALFSQLPAALVYHHVAAYLPRQSPTLTGVGGTVWHGRANEVRLAGSRLGEVDWTLAVLPLLYGHLKLDVQLRDGSEYVGGEVALSLRNPQRVTVQHIEGQMSADRLTSFIPYVPVVPKGRLALLLSEARLDGPHVLDAKGRIVWSGSGLAAPQALDFGDLSANIEPLGKGKGAKAVLGDQGGPLKLAGQFIVDAGGRLSLSARVGAGPKAPADLINSLAMLGHRDIRGRYALNWAGSY